MARLPEATAEGLLALAPPMEHDSGTVLLRQGESGVHVYLLRSVSPSVAACVKVTATLENGSESLLGIRLGGDIIGELASLLDGTRSATVTTCTRIVAHSIPHGVFSSFLRQHPEAWRVVSQMIAERLRWANQRRLDFSGYDVAVRLARVLVELVERHGRRTQDGIDPGVRLSQPELGRLIGAKEDTVALAMRELRLHGLVKTHYRGVLVTDFHGLQKFGHTDR